PMTRKRRSPNAERQVNRDSTASREVPFLRCDVATARGRSGSPDRRPGLRQGADGATQLLDVGRLGHGPARHDGRVRVRRERSYQLLIDRGQRGSQLEDVNGFEWSCPGRERRVGPNERGEPVQRTKRRDRGPQLHDVHLLDSALRAQRIVREEGSKAGKDRRDGLRRVQRDGAGASAGATAAAPAGEGRARGGRGRQGDGGAARIRGGAGRAAGDAGRRTGDGAAAGAGVTHGEREGLKGEGSGHRGGRTHRDGAGGGAGATAAAPAGEGRARGGRGGQGDGGAAGEFGGATDAAADDAGGRTGDGAVTSAGLAHGEREGLEGEGGGHRSGRTHRDGAAGGGAVKGEEPPVAYVAAPVAPQAMPAGALVTVPLPAPVLLTVSVKV